ncbi:MAG: type II toxin-antitoxin system RelB/DinJ family antitoxin [Oceanospirillaceae bacterium]
MTKVQANYRIDVEVKEQAYQVLDQIGIRPTDAVNMLMHHIAMFKELPFRPSVPNAETVKVFDETDAGKGLNRHDNVDAIFDALD